MSLNISASDTSERADEVDCGPAAASGADDNETTPGRRQLIDELTAELTSWNPREFIFAFRRMHRGSISLIHVNVLTLIEAEGQLPMGRLAELLDVSVASATGIVNRMEARGLVERTHSDIDRRVVLVRRTTAGEDVFRDMDEHRRAGLKRLLDQLTDEQLAGFLTGHRALRAARAAYVAEAEAAHAAELVRAGEAVRGNQAADAAQYARTAEARVAAARAAATRVAEDNPTAANAQSPSDPATASPRARRHGTSA